ncbi:MAG TPA: hypothetical protein VJU86_08950 [Pyrinomonadaceae bacterium]|nr:hypothetical protein [Pyrinomonadaceae bacterium]
MNTRRSNGFRAVAVFLAFAVVQVSLQLSIAAPSESTFPSVIPQGVLGRITSKGSVPATINGNNAVSGDTVPSGATIQTPNDTEATIDLGALGTIKMDDNTRIKLDYSCPPDAMSNPNPDACRVTVTVLAGCIEVHYRQGTHHEIFNDKQDRIAQSDVNKERSGGGVLKTCHDVVPPAVATTAGGLGKTGLIALIVGAALIPPIVILATGGDDPSPSTP